MVYYWLIAILGVLLAALVCWLVRRRKTADPSAPATYSGPIRFTDPSGRNMKIIQKDDGSFETVEE